MASQRQADKKHKKHKKQSFALLQVTPFRYFSIFFSIAKHAFIFDRCRRNSAAVTPVKYECDPKNLHSTLVKPNIP